MIFGVTVSLTSCNDFLDREPLSAVTPNEYFTTADQLAAYSISKYTTLFNEVHYMRNPVNLDGGTDNMVVGNASLQYYEKGYWKVPETSGDWDFSLIRYCNYFFEQVLPKYKAGQISGSEATIKHYIGEMYFLRALTYFKSLIKYGDFPIITKTLNDDKNELIKYGIRQPRNLVARFIIANLDSAALMMQNQGFMSNTRLNKQCALLLKSRVALFEATFLKYHKGTGRVPGDETWPGKIVHPNFTLDVDAEVSYFLDEAMKSAAEVADNIKLTTNSGVMNPRSDAEYSGWNPYFEMYSSTDLSKYPEVLFWKQYGTSGVVSITHNASNMAYKPNDNGVTKDYVESFLMKDGMPWYASNTDCKFQGDVTIDKVKANRDLRLQLFVFGESDKLPAIKSKPTAPMTLFTKPDLAGTLYGTRDLTGYRIRKYLSYDPNQVDMTGSTNTTGCIIYRAVEAYLNYIEADYLKNGSISAKSDSYWKAIRARAGIDTDYTKTINATDMSKESDLAKLSGTTLVDATLFNIRRERRCEFIGEGMRMNDLLRWRSMDAMLTQRYVPMGFNLWDEAYKLQTKLIYDGSSKSNVSSPELGKYLCPYSAVWTANNTVREGYIWSKANYLYPVPIKEIKLLSPNDDIEHSVIYQNPYWPNEISASALE